MSSKKSSDDDSKKSDEAGTTASPFVTTSDVLNRLNTAIAQQAGTDTGRFELQKRLPDGSAVPANESEIQSADFENKLQQAGAYVQTQLKSDDEKIQWCEQQRLQGNKLFQKAKDDNDDTTGTQAAMDVYLTCLVVAADNSVQPKDRRLLLFAKTLNNLAVCTSSLSNHSKTVQFCTLGLDYIDENTTNDTVDVELHRQNSKLHFKRAKASRLRGDYKTAASDLDQAYHTIVKDDNGDEEAQKIKNAIQSERQLLARAVETAKLHKVQQERAMKQQFQTSSTTTSANNKKNSSTTTRVQSTPKPLYGTTTETSSRTFSTLRAPSFYDDDDDEEQQQRQLSTFQSFWYTYLQKIGAQAQQLLHWLDAREEERQRQKQD